MPNSHTLSSQQTERPSLIGLIKDSMIFLSVLGICLAFLPNDARAEAADREVKILFEHYSDDPNVRKALVKNVEATRRSFEGMAQLTILVSDEAVVMADVGRNLLPEALKRLINQGVEVLACESSLESHGIAAEDVDPMIGTVKSASDEIQERRERGWVIVAEGETYVSGLHN